MESKRGEGREEKGRHRQKKEMEGKRRKKEWCHYGGGERI